MNKVVFLIALFLISSAVKAEYIHRCLPKNDIELPVINQKNFVMKSIETTGLSELEFYQVIESFKVFWKPIIDIKYSKKLIVRGDWNDPKVDAYATRDDDDNPVIVIQGGLARHKEMTLNGLLLILCHELGHHYGGAPKSFRGRSTKRSWSSAEGQADYFAANKCMSKMIEYNIVFNTGLNETDKNADGICADKYCHKVLPAALSVGKLFASLKEDWRAPSVTSKSRSKVYSTNYEHPDPQCRFDTFVAGSLCSSEFEIDFDNEDYRVGACITGYNPEAARPNCWFAPTDF